MQGHSHSHGHGGGHSHGGGHQHHAGCSHGHSQQHQVEPEQYFQKLQELKQTNKEFYWNQIIKGAVLSKYFQKFGMGFINSFSAMPIIGLVGMVHMMITCDWMPLKVRPFVSGIFWPLLLYVFVNYKIITGIISNPDSKQQNEPAESLDRSVILPLFIIPLALYALVALRSSGRLLTKSNKKLAKKILQVRPYLENPGMMCKACDMPKAFRSVHCPMCKTCIPKFTRHSLVFGVCIGAANELLSLLFFMSMTILSCYSLYRFSQLISLFGILTIAMFYLLNLAIAWMSFVQTSTLFILNIYFGLTEFEVQNWMMLQYLMKIPVREFLNSCNNGIFYNFTQGLWALLGISGYEAELHDQKSSSQQREDEPLQEQISYTESNKTLSFPQVKDNTKYVVNWAKAYIVVVPQMPNHPRRKQIMQMMRMQEPMMITNFRLIKKFKQQIKLENPELNQFQVQQKAMMKMSEHMSKNPHMAAVSRPPPEQQRAIQLQMLAHMKQQFKNDVEIYGQFESIEKKLKSGESPPEQTQIKMREIQQKIMQKKMKQVLQAQKQQQQQQQQKQQKSGTQSPTIQQKSLQQTLQAQMLQKLEQRSKQTKQQEKLEQKQNKKRKSQKEQESDKLNASEEIIDDENL